MPRFKLISKPLSRVVAVLAFAGVAAGLLAATAFSSTGAPAVPASILSRTGPFPGPTWYGDQHVVIRTEGPKAATSLAALRSMVGCSPQLPYCWQDARPQSGQELLVAVESGGCPGVSSVDAQLLRAAELQLQLGRGSCPAGAGTAPRPSLMLIGIPLASLPHHVLLTVVVAGGTAPTTTTTVRLP